MQRRDSATWATFLVRWAEAHPRPAIAAEVLVWISNGGDLATIVPREIAAVTAKQLGKRLRDHLGACYGGLSLTQGRPTREKTNTWVVTRAADQATDLTSRAVAADQATGPTSRAVADPTSRAGAADQATDLTSRAADRYSDVLVAQKAVQLVLEPSACRLCGKPSWAADADGPVHPCCIGAVARGETYCVGCHASLRNREPVELV